MRQILIALDQLANTLLAGHADETLSARAYRLSRDRGRHWPRRVIVCNKRYRGSTAPQCSVFLSCQPIGELWEVTT